MIVALADPDDVPGVAVLDAFFRIVAAKGDHAPDAECVAEAFDGLCDAFAHTDALPERADDLVRVRLFQLIVTHIFTDKIVNILLLF